MKTLLLSLASFFLFACMENANALDITFLGGMNHANYSYDTTSVPSLNYSTTSSSTEFTYAGMLQFGAFPGIGLETGVQYIPRHATIDYGAGSTSEVNFSNWMFPLMLRVTGLPVVSFGAGFYYMSGSGQVTTTGTGSIPSSVADFDTTGSGIKRAEFGAILNGRAAYSLAALTSAVFDVRYDIGLTDRSANPAWTNMKFKDLLFQIGISFGI